MTLAETAPMTTMTALPVDGVANTPPGLVDAMLDAAVAAAAHLPGSISSGTVRVGADVLGVLVPGAGSLAVMTTLTGGLRGTLVLAVSARMAQWAVRELQGPKDLEFALEPPLARAMSPLAHWAGAPVMGEAPILLDSELALLDADLAEDASEVYATALYLNRSHEATLVLVTAGATGAAPDLGVSWGSGPFALDDEDLDDDVDDDEDVDDLDDLVVSDEDDDLEDEPADGRDDAEAEDEFLAEDDDLLWDDEPPAEHGWSDDLDDFAFGSDEPAPKATVPLLMPADEAVDIVLPEPAPAAVPLPIPAVTVVAAPMGIDLGTASIGAGELVALLPGAVVPLHATEGPVVELRVGGRLVGRAELVGSPAGIALRVRELVGEDEVVTG